MLGNQNSLYVSSIIRQEHDMRKTKYRGSGKKNWMLLLLIGNHVKPPEERTLPPLRSLPIERNQSACVI